MSDLVRSSQVADLAAPFTTFSTWVMDVPGVKKGLGHRLLEPDHPIIGTDSLAVCSMLVKRAALRSINRAALLSMTFDDYELAKELSAASGYSLRPMPNIVVRQLTNPLYAEVTDFSNGNALAMSLSVIRSLSLIHI